MPNLFTIFDQTTLQSLEGWIPAHPQRMYVFSQDPLFMSREEADFALADLKRQYPDHTFTVKPVINDNLPN
jgi:hypothetical protein